MHEIRSKEELLQAWDNRDATLKLPPDRGPLQTPEELRESCLNWIAALADDESDQWGDYIGGRQVAHLWADARELGLNGLPAQPEIRTQGDAVRALDQLRVWCERAIQNTPRTHSDSRKLTDLEMVILGTLANSPERLTGPKLAEMMPEPDNELSGHLRGVLAGLVKQGLIINGGKGKHSKGYAITESGRAMLNQSAQ